jgi:very-short-patch-repair endonuclease
MPLRSVIRDWSWLDEEERKYISHYSTHLDFIIFNHVTKKPVMAIETDGYNYHNDKTEQYQRDLKKNHILALYGLPLLRLKTNESGEKEKIVSMLTGLVSK